MSILIKMEMPKNCMDCPMNYDSIDCVLAEDISLRDKDLESLYENNRHPNCPLIEVPKHGRLIDADAISEDDRQVYGFYNSYDLQQLIDNAPTIIEAEGEDE